MVKRTQIYFDDETYSYLKEESEHRHVTMSELIRSSIQDQKKKRINEVLQAADRVSGIWKDRKGDVNEQIRALRKDREL